MRFTTIAAFLFAGVVLAKNVVFLDKLTEAIDKQNEPNQKRDAKNVANLNAIKQAIDDEKNTKRQDVLQSDPFSSFFLGDSSSSHALLANIIPNIQTASIFFSLLRDNEDLTHNVESSKKFSVLVPPSDNVVVSELDGKKPWEYPELIQDNETDDEVIKSNLQNFLEAHMATGSIEIENEKLTTTLLNGKSLVVSRDPKRGTYELAVDGKTVGVTAVYAAENGVVLISEHVLNLL